MPEIHVMHTVDPQTLKAMLGDVVTLEHTTSEEGRQKSA